MNPDKVISGFGLHCMLCGGCGQHWHLLLVVGSCSAVVQEEGGDVVPSRSACVLLRFVFC